MRVELGVLLVELRILFGKFSILLCDFCVLCGKRFAVACGRGLQRLYGSQLFRLRRFVLFLIGKARNELFVYEFFNPFVNAR